MAIKITRSFDGMADRYAFDFGACSHRKGWAQLDTRQDASYYGTWVNPTARKLFSYCEGDMTLTECDTDEEFTTVLRECVDWQRNAGHFIGIDGMLNQAIIDALTRLGFAADLH